jgi:hypothetical protein
MLHQQPHALPFFSTLKRRFQAAGSDVADQHRSVEEM